MLDFIILWYIYEYYLIRVDNLTIHDAHSVNECGRMLKGSKQLATQATSISTLDVEGDKKSQENLKKKNVAVTGLLCLAGLKLGTVWWRKSSAQKDQWQTPTDEIMKRGTDSWFTVLSSCQCQNEVKQVPSFPLIAFDDSSFRQEVRTLSLLC